MEENEKKPKINMPRVNLSWFFMFIALAIGYLYFTSDGSGMDKQIT